MTIKSELGKFLYCSSLLEKRVAETYEHIANLVDDKAIRCLLMYIAHDSLKHAEYFRSMAELLSHGIKMCIEDCVKIWGELWLNIVKDAEKIRERVEIRAADLKLLVSSLERIEGFAAEEYLTALHTKLIDLMAAEEGVDLGHLKTLLNWIIEDEDKHKQILRMIKDLSPRFQ